jgi:hypothetical protein
LTDRSSIESIHDRCRPTVLDGLEHTALDVLKGLDVRLPEHRMGLGERIPLVGIDQLRSGNALDACALQVSLTRSCDALKLMDVTNNMLN